MNYSSVELLKNYLENATPAELEQNWLAVKNLEFDGPTLEELLFVDLEEGWFFQPFNEINVSEPQPEVFSGCNNTFSLAA